MNAVIAKNSGGSNGIQAFRGAGFHSERVTTSPARGDIVNLVQGVIGAVTVPEFFSPHECQAIMSGLEHCQLDSYDEALLTPRVGKLGPVSYEFYRDGRFSDEYWAQARNSTTARSTLLSGDDPADIALGRLRAMWDGPVEVARVDGKSMFAGLIREMTRGSRIHRDEVVTQFPGVFDDEPMAQLAFNCYIQLPDEGGETIIYRRRWQPVHEESRDGYGYQPDLVSDAPVLAVRPTLGAAVLIDPRNYHKVMPSGAGRERVALSFFIGVMAGGSLLIWS